MVWSMKQERRRWRNYQRRHGARQVMLEYSSMFYHSRRLHSQLNYLNPNEFERNLPERKKAA